MALALEQPSAAEGGSPKSELRNPKADGPGGRRSAPLAFEQQPRESDKAFAAFSLYLSLGPERSLAAVAAKLGKCGSLMERWSGKFAWRERVRAHGAHLAL